MHLLWHQQRGITSTSISKRAWPGPLASANSTCCNAPLEDTNPSLPSRSNNVFLQEMFVFDSTVSKKYGFTSEVLSSGVYGLLAMMWHLTRFIGANPRIQHHIWEQLLDYGRLDWSRTMKKFKVAPLEQRDNILYSFDSVWSRRAVMYTRTHLSVKWKLMPPGNLLVSW